MLTIKKLKMWKDPKYTRQCVEVPPLGSWKLPAPNYISGEDLRPRRGSTLSAMELPLSYLAVHDMSYLYMEIEDGVTPTPNTMKIFGWILSVTETASANEAVRIEWTPDYWRTYANDATYGKGTITRCNNATYKRPYETQPRKMLYSKSLNPFNAFPGPGNAFLMMVSEYTGNDLTGFSFYYAELDVVESGFRTPKTSEVYGGLIDEVTGVVPSSIIGCWIIPATIIKSGNIFTPGWTTIDIVYGGEHVQCLKKQGISDTPIISGVTITGLSGYLSDDMNKCISINPYGNIESVLPWGFGFASDVADLITDLSADGVNIYLIEHGISPEVALSQGNYLKFSGIPVPVNTNAWSEYAYTYQRSYDKRIAEIQRNQQLVSGLTGVSQSIIGGAIAGATKGSVAGAGVGAVAGGISSVIGSVAGYFTQGKFNDELQKETDKLVSNQSSNILIGGAGLGWKELIKGWKIVQLTADSVSATEYSQHITNDGYTTEIPVGNPNSFLTAGGPLQIQNLVLTGAIPPEAKTYIKNILSNGVRIVENNPSGVVP